jgi:hypothetical protein
MNATSRSLEHPEVCCDVPRLLQQFESLGENCDLGVVQRAVGLEPFGLFRFAACDAAGILKLLRARLEPLCEPEDLILEEVGPRREYWLKSRAFPFESHTNRYAPQDEAAVVRAGEIEKMRYLKAHFLQDLARGRRLLVYKGKSELATMRELAAQLQTLGPNSLLWVDVAGATQEPGSVERESAALLRGYVSRFGTYEDDPSLPVEEWVRVCAAAFRLWRNQPPPLAPLENLLGHAVAADRCAWSAPARGITRRLTEPALPGGELFEHCPAAGEPASVWQARLPLDYGGKLVFSAWVRLPENGNLDHVSLVMTGFATTAAWRVDLRARGNWQRTWISAEVPQGTRALVCELRAAGAPGALFHSSRWCLERGTRPSGFGFVL